MMTSVRFCFRHIEKDSAESISAPARCLFSFATPIKLYFKYCFQITSLRDVDITENRLFSHQAYTGIIYPRSSFTPASCRPKCQSGRMRRAASRSYPSLMRISDLHLARSIEKLYKQAALHAPVPESYLPCRHGIVPVCHRSTAIRTVVRIPERIGHSFKILSSFGKRSSPYKPVALCISGAVVERHTVLVYS